MGNGITAAVRLVDVRYATSDEPGASPAKDNLLNQKFIGEFLQLPCIKVVMAGNGQKALDQLAAERFDAALMNVHMPEMDGLTATQQIRQRESLKKREETEP